MRNNFLVLNNFSFSSPKKKILIQVEFLCKFGSNCLASERTLDNIHEFKTIYFVILLYFRQVSIKYVSQER